MKKIIKLITIRLPIAPPTKIFNNKKEKILLKEHIREIKEYLGDKKNE